MSYNEIYMKKFEELAATEEKFMELYKFYAGKAEDAYLLAKFKEIYEDEKKHVAIARGFIKIISEGEN